MNFLQYYIALAIFCPIISIAQSTTYSYPAGKSLKIGLKDNINTNETVVMFKKGYSALYQTADGDAPSTGGSSISIASLTSDNKIMSINFMPELSDLSEVKLTVNAKTSKKAVLFFKEVPLAENYKLILVDKYLNIETTIRYGTSYELTIDKTVQQSFGNDRLSIIIKPAMDIIDGVASVIEKNDSPLKVFPNPVGANLFIDAGNVSRSIIEAYIYNLAGNLVKQAKVTDNTGIDVSNLLTQNYIIVLKDVKTDKQLAVSKFLKE